MLVLVPSIHVPTHLPRLNNYMRCYYQTYRGTMVVVFFTAKIFFVLGRNITPIWNYCLVKFYTINLSIHAYPRNN